LQQRETHSHLRFGIRRAGSTSTTMLQSISSKLARRAGGGVGVDSGGGVGEPSARGGGGGGGFQQYPHRKPRGGSATASGGGGGGAARSSGIKTPLAHTDVIVGKRVSAACPSGACLLYFSYSLVYLKLAPHTLSLFGRSAPGRFRRWRVASRSRVSMTDGLDRPAPAMRDRFLVRPSKRALSWKREWTEGISYEVCDWKSCTAL
jgi:hypothetical protein